MNFLSRLLPKPKELSIVKQGPKAVEKAVEVLTEGGIVIYPTETSYGIGIDATNKSAVRDLYRIKGRNSKKNISVLMSDIKMIKKNIVLTKDSERVVNKLMPGPLTIICNKKENSKIVCSDNSIAFRISSNNFATKLVSALGNPITATSANLSDTPPLHKKVDVMSYFVDKVDMIIDAGDLIEGRSSTLFDMATKKILRKGPITKYDIMNAILGKTNRVNKQR